MQREENSRLESSDSPALSPKEGAHVCKCKSGNGRKALCSYPVEKVATERVCGYSKVSLVRWSCSGVFDDPEVVTTVTSILSTPSLDIGTNNGMIFCNTFDDDRGEKARTHALVNIKGHTTFQRAAAMVDRGTVPCSKKASQDGVRTGIYYIPSRNLLRMAFVVLATIREVVDC